MAQGWVRGGRRNQALIFQYPRAGQRDYVYALSSDICIREGNHSIDVMTKMQELFPLFSQSPDFPKKLGNKERYLEFKSNLQTEDAPFFTNNNLFVYTITGQKDWFAPDETIRVGAGEAIFLRRGGYRTKQTAEENTGELRFFMSDAFIQKFLAENDFRGPSPSPNHSSIYQVQTDESLATFIQSISFLFSRSRAIPQALIELKGKELLHTMLLIPGNLKILDYFHTICYNDRDIIKEIMLRNFQFELSMEEFAQLCGKSLSSFKREFKDLFHTTPAKWLAKKRLEQAEMLLMSSDLSISEICYQVGLKNPSHFNRVFKEFYGLPPAQYKISRRKA